MKVNAQEINDYFAIYNGDSIEVLKDIPEKSIGFSIFSPPFSEIFYYSDIDNDMGNSKDYANFFNHFDYLIPELYRVLSDGRLVAIHCMDIASFKNKQGYIGLIDFPGDIIRHFEHAGFRYHSRITIWKDPLLEAMKNKTHGLLYNNLQKDGTVSRQGVPDTLIIMRKGDNGNVDHNEKGENSLSAFEYFGSDAPQKYYGRNIDRGETKYNHVVWQRYASPVWMDIRQTRTLQRESAREERDEKHICPLQLDTIGRSILLWSNPGDIILSPFAGIGSEIYQAILMGRKGIGIELKESYYKQAVNNCMNAVEETKRNKLF